MRFKFRWPIFISVYYRNDFFFFKNFVSISSYYKLNHNINLKDSHLSEIKNCEHRSDFELFVKTRTMFLVVKNAF